MHTYPEMTLQLLEADYPYAISFTYENDNRFLWDSYTNNKGVCLEFSKQQLNEYFNKKYKDKLVLDKVVNDIIYDDSDQILIIKEILDNPTKYPIKEALLMLSPLFKNPFWKLEKECRTVFMSNYLNDKTFEVKENYDLKYNNGYKTQDYIEVEFPKKLLKSITTGPMNSKENLEKYIREGLDRDIKNDAEKNNILEYFNKLKKEKSSGEDIIRK